VGNEAGQADSVEWAPTLAADAQGERTGAGPRGNSQTVEHPDAEGDMRRASAPGQG